MPVYVNVKKIENNRQKVKNETTKRKIKGKKVEDNNERRQS